LPQSHAAGALTIAGRCGALGASALLAALWMAPMRAAEDLDAPIARVEGVGNASLREVPAASDGSWAVQILADIQDGFPYLQRIVREGAEQGARAIVVAGDLQRGDGGRHLGLVLRELHRRETQAPLFVVPGNHDAMTPADRAAFEAAFGGDRFEFRIGSTWFVGLDSTDSAGFAEERRRLRTRIAAAAEAGENVVVVRHHSPLSDVGGLADAELLHLLEHPSVAFVIAGHAHTSRVDRIGATRFVVAPPSGDRSHGQGQTAVSYLMLRSSGGRLRLELHQFSRQNRVDAESAWTHAWLVHLAPWLRASPMAATLESRA
jgi:Icc-related predicted phosphoesterase